MHYMKCSVNGSVVLNKIRGTLNLYLITTHTHTHVHYLQFGWFINWLLCDVPWHKTRQTGPRHTYHSLCPAASRKKTAEEFFGFCWPVLVVAAVEPRYICCGRTWPSNQTGRGAILVFSSFLDQIPHQVKSQTSVGIFRHTWRQESSLSFLLLWQTKFHTHTKQQAHLLLSVF